MKKERNGQRAEPAPRNEQDDREDAVSPGKVDFPIVALGASAGGLQALDDFFDHMPSDSGMAFVVVQHLSPDHKSRLRGLLERHTDMPVLEIEDGMRVRPEQVYIIPPNRDLTILDGVLELKAPETPKGVRLTIDIFFRSLAEDQEKGAIGVILSGAGSDGTLGITAIKEAGGAVLVQDPETAQYPSMPRNAAGTQLADFVLPPQEMPQALIDYVERAFVPEEIAAPVTPEEADELLQRIFVLLRNRTGHDFGGYKRNTVSRRIQRRMAVNRVDDLAGYVRYLRRNPHEISTLFKELLIGVTRFFRDPEAFALLEKEVIPQLLENGEGPIRVWVPGCATGEEAYSIAILFQERIEALNRQRLRVQIFATDVDEGAIAKAREGVYHDSIAADVSPERLDRFFLQHDHVFEVAESVRKMVVFAAQSVIKDPPFSRLDLISCRNLLIYLMPELQSKVLSLFRYALKEGGFLFLGTSETLIESAPHFAVVDRKWKLFRRLDSGAEHRLPFDFLAPPWTDKGMTPGMPDVSSRANVRRLLERALLEQHISPSLVVNEGGQILYTYGRVSKFIEPAVGETGSWDILQVLRQELRMPVGTSLRQAATRDEPVAYEGVRFTFNGEQQAVNLRVEPLRRPASLKGLLLVRFEPVVMSEAGAAEREPVEGSATQKERIRELERELQATREYLQATIEELQSSNEEIKSTNEELQSANEELETAQEEAQSVNEELSTLNEELEDKVDELTWANSDMQNVLSSIDVGIVFLDRSMKVRRFNQAATQVINLIQSDVGRPIKQITSELVDADWIQEAQEVFESLEPRERQVQTKGGNWYEMRMRPYRTAEDAIEGVVLTFTEITEQKQTEQGVRQARRLAESIVDTVREPLLVLDGELTVISANRAFYRTFQVPPQETQGRPVYELGNGQWDIPELRHLLEEIIPEDQAIEDYEVVHDFEGIGRKKMLLNARRMWEADGGLELILLAIEDVREA